MAKNPQSDLVQPNERVDDLQNGFYVPDNSDLEGCLLQSILLHLDNWKLPDIL